MHKQAIPPQAGNMLVWFITGCASGVGLERAADFPKAIA